MGCAVNLRLLTSAEYALLRSRAIQYCRNAGLDDPESLADESIARLLTTAQDVENLEAFVIGICHNVVLEEVRRLKRDRAIAGAALDGVTPPEPYDHAEYQICFTQLPASERRLIEAYVGSGAKGIEKRRQLAIKLGISDEALRKRVQRIRDKLKACLEDRMRGKRHA